MGEAREGKGTGGTYLGRYAENDPQITCEGELRNRCDASFDCLKLHQHQRPHNLATIPRYSLSSSFHSFKSFKMDTLVSRYSQPMFEKEYSEEDQLELYQSTPSLSLKFAMPPIAQVRI